MSLIKDRFSFVTQTVETISSPLNAASSVHRLPSNPDQGLCNRGDLIHYNQREGKKQVRRFGVSEKLSHSLKPSNLGIPYQYLRWPLLAMDASGFGVPFRAASCCSKAFDSKYSSHAAASCNIEIYLQGKC